MLQIIKLTILTIMLFMLAPSSTAKNLGSVRLTPLMNAIYENDMAKLSAMLNNKADPNEKNKDGLTPLYLGIITCNVKVVQLLLEHGATQEKIVSIPPLSFTDNCNDNSTTFKIVEQLIKHGLPREHIKEDGIMPTLMSAIIRKNKKLVELLIEYGASVNIENEAGQTPLLDAVIMGQSDVVRLLFEAGAQSKNKSLILADALGRPKILKLVIDNGIGPDSYVPVGDYKESLIKVAFNVNDPNSIKILIESGIDVNVATRKGVTPLIFASEKGHAELAKALLQKGADINLKDNAGNNALYYAEKNGHVEIVKMLKLAAHAVLPLPKPVADINEKQSPEVKKDQKGLILWLLGGGIVLVGLIAFMVRRRGHSDS